MNSSLKTGLSEGRFCRAKRVALSGLRPVPLGAPYPRWAWSSAWQPFPAQHWGARGSPLASLALQTPLGLRVLWGDGGPCLAVTQLSHLLGSRDVLRLSEKYKEEMQMSTRAVHILRVSQEQGWAVPEAPIQTLSGCR